MTYLERKLNNGEEITDTIAETHVLKARDAMWSWLDCSITLEKRREKRSRLNVT
jgi:hypothetical protein